MTRRWWLMVSIAAAALLLLAGRASAGVYAEWTWFASMGALPLYRSQLAHESALFGGAFLAGFALALANLYAFRRSIVSLVLPRRLGNLEIGETVPGRRLTALVFVVAAALGVALSIDHGNWTTLALAHLGIPFGETDPFTERDLGFYVYRLPLERSLFVWAVGALALTGAVVVLLYALTPSLRWERGRLYMSTYVRRHLAVLGALALVLVSWSYRIDGASILGGGSGSLGAFTAFDHRIAVPWLQALSFGALVAAPLLLWSGWNGHRRVTLVILVFLLLAGPVAGAALPMLSRWSTTEIEARAREAPYLRTRALFTRRAFGLERVVDADSAFVDAVSRDAMAAGVPSWDQAALMRTAAMDRAGVRVGAFAWTASADGMSADIAERPATGSGEGWQLTTVDATTSDERGRALLRVAFAPAAADRGMPTIVTAPDATGWTVVADSSGRVAAPPLNRWWERLAHAWNQRSPGLLALDPPAPRPRILFRRDVRDRIAALAPFFTIGPSLFAVMRGDSLYWTADLFVTSDDYPLSEAVIFGGAPRHYVRKAATAFVQAQTGRVTLIAERQPDAVTRSWMRRFPTLFVTPSELPPELDALRPPPVDVASVQASALVRAGFTRESIQPRSLAPANDADADLADGGPAFFAPHGDRGPLAWSLGLVDAGGRVLGALVARGGDSSRVEWRRAPARPQWSATLETLQRTADSAGFGRQRRFSRRGHVHLVPVADGMAFVQSFYEWPPDAPPSLAGVVLLSPDGARSGATLREALGATRRQGPDEAASLRARVAALYDLMSAAMRRGDWLAFGDAWSRLGRLLRSAP